MALVACLGVAGGCSASGETTAPPACLDRAVREDRQPALRHLPGSCAPEAVAAGTDQGLQAAAFPSAGGVVATPTPSALRATPGPQSSATSTPPRQEGTASAQRSASPALPPASQVVGRRSNAGAGSYLLWVRADHRVYIVANGVVRRSMPTTAELTKTPPGDYAVQYKVRRATSTEDGIDWLLPNFLAFYHRPGATATIGFHAIPLDAHTGRPAQPVDTLGLPGHASHGCARLAPADAEAVYSFAHEGTTVKVR